MCPVIQQEAHTAHFDASGSRHSGKFFVVGGYISNVDNWKEFDREWGILLKEADVPYFRAAEFFPSAGYFKKWKHDQTAHDNFNNKLLSLQVRYVKSAFIVAIPLLVWQEVNQRFSLKESGLFPYVRCGLGCVRRVREWCNEKSFPFSRTRTVFKEGTHDWGHLQKWIDEEFGFKPLPGKKLEIPGLQAADYVAWQIHTLCKRLSKIDSLANMLRSLEAVGTKLGSREGLRRDCNALVKGIPFDDCLWSPEELIQFCDEGEIPAR
jgi:hypothetical protein